MRALRDSRPDSGWWSPAASAPTASCAQQLDAACRASAACACTIPSWQLCTDNGAMIALAAAMRLQSGRAAPAFDYAFDVRPRWELGPPP